MGDAEGGGRKRKLCVVCMESPREVLFTACGHFLLCEGCTAQLLARGAPCPTCRMSVRAVGGTRIKAPPAAAASEQTVASFQRDAVDPVARARALAPPPQRDHEADEDAATPWAETP
jgi:hypothetical protein